MEKELQFTSDYDQNIQKMDSVLHPERSFDLINRKFKIGGRRATLYLIDGFAQDELLEKILEYNMKLTPEDLKEYPTAEQFSDKYITHVETTLLRDVRKAVVMILSGTVGLVVEGFDAIIMMDAKSYPFRGVQEPESDRVLRGSHDGFTEVLIFNTALIRRRIRDSDLVMEYLQVGTSSHTDMALCYLNSQVNQKMLKNLRERIQKLNVKTLTMNQESLAECLMAPQWFNPFPQVRYSERPDAVAASIAEGNIVLVMDNTSSVMILPTSLLCFVQDTNDYYFPPIVGTYLRFVRMFVFLLTIFLTPIWYLLIQNPDIIPPWLSFIQMAEEAVVPVIAQLLVIEFVIDALKLASLNTPNVLSNSFSIVGALVLGDFAVQANWFSTEVVLYMAFIAIATFTQPSFELSWAFKLFRLVTLILTALLNYWGFAAGVLLLVLTIAATKTLTGRDYLYPLIPFNWNALTSLLVRKPITKKQP